MYMKNCPKCNLQHSKLGKFCSRKCANSRTWNEEDKIKKSISAKNSTIVLLKNKQHIVEKIKLNCDNCNIDFYVVPSYKDNHFCSKKCWDTFPNKGKYFKSQMGGYRKNSGRGKQGWYKGYFCQSSWELAWVIYQLDHELDFKRNTQGFEYEFENKKYKFYPDFILNTGEYVEVKGYMTEKNKSKFLHFPHTLTVIGKNDIKPYIEYVEKKYGKNYLNLYEKN